MRKNQNIIKSVVIDYTNKFDELMGNVTQTQHTSTMLKNVGLALYVYSVPIQSKKKDVTFQIWNITPEERMINFAAVYMRGSMCIFLIIDPHEEEIFHKIKRMLDLYFIFSKKDPILINLINGTAKYDTYVQEIFSDLEQLIEETYQISTIHYAQLQGVADLKQAFTVAAEAIAKIIDTDSDKFEEHRIFKITEAVLALTDYFPNIKDRIRIKETGILVKGKLCNYFIDFYGTVYRLEGANQKIAICLEDRYGDVYKRYTQTIEFFENHVLKQNLKLNPQYLEIIAKIFYLLNDSYYYSKDPVFKKQI